MWGGDGWLACGAERILDMARHVLLMCSGGQTDLWKHVLPNPSGEAAAPLVLLQARGGVLRRGRVYGGVHDRYRLLRPVSAFAGCCRS